MAARMRLARLMVNHKRDVSNHPWFNFAYDRVLPSDMNVRHAAASLALDGYPSRRARHKGRKAR
jgi:hypothetical protein